MILYNKDRDPEELEPYYTRHVMAMTDEDLRAKCDIAAELAHRDKMIDEAISILETSRAWPTAGRHFANKIKKRLGVRQVKEQEG